MILMNKWLAAAVSCVALSLTACGDSNSSNQTAAPAPASDTNSTSTASAPASGKVLRVAMNAEFAPFESLDAQQNIEGFDVDLMNAMAKAGNFQVQFQHQPWDSLFPALSQGDVDVVMSGVTITDERKMTMDFTEPYYQITQVVLVAPGKKVQNINDVKSLSKVGVVSGHTGDFAAQKIFGATSGNIARFKTLPLMLKEVESSGVDAGISDSAVVANYVKNNESKGFTMVQVPDFTTENYGIAVKKGNQETLDMLNAALKKVRESGEYAQIESKYFAK